MRDVEARRAELALNIDPTVAEMNELRDCEIALGMTTAGPEARSEAARRVEKAHAARNGGAS